jgi:hypothetical protein
LQREFVEKPSSGRVSWERYYVLRVEWKIKNLAAHRWREDHVTKAWTDVTEQVKSALREHGFGTVVPVLQKVFQSCAYCISKLKSVAALSVVFSGLVGLVFVVEEAAKVITVVFRTMKCVHIRQDCVIFCVFALSCWDWLEQEFAKGVLEREGKGSSNAKWLTALLYGLYWHGLRTAYVGCALHLVNMILLRMATELNKSTEFVRFGVTYIPDAVTAACKKLLQVLGMRMYPYSCVIFQVFLILIQQFDICRSFVPLIFVVCSTYSLSPFFYFGVQSQKNLYIQQCHCLC